MSIFKYFSLITSFAVLSTSFFSLSLNAQTNQQPKGYIDSIHTDCGSSNGSYYRTVTVKGWAMDPDTETASILVHVYANDQMIGEVLANEYRADLGANRAFTFKNTTNFANPSENCGYSSNQINVFGIDSATGSRGQNNAPLGKATGLKVTVASSVSANNPVTTSTNAAPNMPKPAPTVTQAAATQIKWQGVTAEYDWNSRVWNTTENVTNWQDRQCGDLIPGIMNETCQKVITEANGRTVYASRSRYMAYAPAGSNLTSFSTQNGLNGTYKGVRWRQIFYTYFDTNTNQYKNFFFYDQNGNRQECTNAQCSNVTWIKEGIN